MNLRQIEREYSCLVSEGTQKRVASDDAQAGYIGSLMPESGAARILDAGCGNGMYAEYFSMLGYHRIHRCDLFHAQGGGAAPGNYVCASVAHLPYKKNSFDFVYSNSVLYYLERPALAIREFARILNPGGVLFFSGHTRWSVYSMYRKAKCLMRHSSVTHLQGVMFHTTGSYLDILRDSGFTLLFTDGWSPSTRASRMIHRLTGWKRTYRYDGPSRSGHLMRYLRSRFSYHFVIGAQLLR